MIFVVILTAIAAGFIQTVSGFGGALILMMTLPFFLTMKTSTALAGLVCIPTLISVAWQYRKKIAYRQVVFPIIVYLAVSTICIRIAAGINLDGIKAVFGLFLIALAAYFYFFSSKIKIKADMKSALICAGLSGITGGLFGIGGPFLVIYFLAITDDQESYLGTMNFVFIVTETYSAFIRFMSGMITVSLIPVILAGCAGTLGGRFLGKKAMRFINGDQMKKIIYIMLAVSGLTTFLRAIGVF